MYGYGQRNEKAKFDPAAKRNSDANPFSEGVHGHHPDYEQRLAGVQVGHLRKYCRMLITLKKPTHEDDENQSSQRTHQRAQQSVVYALVDEPEASREHEPCGHSVGRPEPAPTEILHEDERQRPIPVATAVSNAKRKTSTVVVSCTSPTLGLLCRRTGVESNQQGAHRGESSAPCPVSGPFLRTSHFSISTAQKMIEPSATAMARSASASASVRRNLWKKGV